MSALILYQTEDGAAQVQLRSEDGSVWLSQMEIAELFAATVPNANIHVCNILKEGELAADSVIKDSLITAVDGLVAKYFLNSDRPSPKGLGYVKSGRMKVAAHEYCKAFDAHRCGTEVVAADEEDSKAWDAIEKNAKRKGDAG